MDTTLQDERPDPAPAGMDADEVYNPVQCSECSTEVAVFDKDEVYHFFNILASHCWDGEEDTFLFPGFVSDSSPARRLQV